MRREEALLRLCDFDSCLGGDKKDVGSSVSKNSASDNAGDFINGIFEQLRLFDLQTVDVDDVVSIICDEIADDGMAS